MISSVLAVGVAQAAMSPKTPAVVGHKPIAKNVKILNVSPVLGDELTLSYEYEDADFDVKDTPTIVWLYNSNEVSGQTNLTYTPTFNPVTQEGVECADVTVQAKVIPKSRTGDPDSGDEVSSQTVKVSINLGTIPGFIKPNAHTQNTWSEANDYCNNTLGARLPTVAELQNVFNTYAQETGFIMSSKYGWPLQAARCGGSSNNYWASDVAPNGLHYDVSMFDGTKFYSQVTDASPFHVACKID